MIHNELTETQRLKITDPWDTRSGKQVEDFITRHIIYDAEYGEDEVLRLKRVGAEDIEVDVSPVQPTYDYSICLYGLRVNGVIHKDPTLLMQYKEGSKVELGVGIRSIMDRSGVVKNYNTTFKINIQFNGQTMQENVRNIDYGFFELQGGNYVLGAKEGLEDAIIWVDVTKLFQKIAKGKKISASFTPGDLELKSELNVSITNEILNLIYNGDIVININKVSLLFDSSLITPSDYVLVYYINGKGSGSDPYRLGSGQFDITNLTPGLNQIVVRAEHHSNSKICSNWVNINIIYKEGFEGTTLAVNGVRDYITNNGVATLYKVIIYSTTKEEFKFTTYLDTEVPNAENPEPKRKIKEEYVTAYSYQDTNATKEYTYQQYIELENTGSAQYLLVQIKDQDFYTFYTGNYSDFSGKYSIYSLPYVKMQVEEGIPEYTYVKGYSMSYNYDQITGQTNNLFITQLQSPTNYTIIPDLESSDGWKSSEGLTYLKLSKQGKSVLRNPVNLQLGNSFTIEMGITTYNISDKNQTILTLGNIGLFPTQLGWLYNDIKSESFLKRNSQFQENQRTHIVLTVQSGWNIKGSVYYPNYLGEGVQTAFDEKASQVSYNLVRMYINGVVDREFILTDEEVEGLKNSTLDIYPKSSDIDIYLFRVYNTQALNHSEVLRNYISFIPSKTGVLSKESIYKHNDILDENTGKISWSKCINNQNTLLFIYHKGGRFPNRFWGQEDNESTNDANKKIPCTLIINYADPVVNARYGGVLDKLQCKGQGSSAMRYLIWNVNSSLNKFKYKVDGEEKKANSKFLPYSNLLTREGKGELLPENTNVDGILNKYYAMPTYKDEQDTTVYKYTKMVGKVNFASSMQSHKIGACKLYDDAYKKNLGTDSLPSKGKKAVHEEPFLYFYVETDEDFNSDYSSGLDIDNITYDKILALGERAEFMGFQTWGPGKGDDACSGYDEEVTQEYLMLEGGENTDSSVNFLRPWQALQRLRTDFVRNGAKYNYALDLKSTPTVNKEQSLAEPWAQLLIDDESIVYTDRGAWDIDYGFVEDEVGDTKYFDFAEGAKISLLKFRDFYDTVYKYDFTYVDVNSSITSPQADWDVYKKYLIRASNFSVDGSNNLSGHVSGDVYRYDEPTKSWVRAGLYYNNGWERLNYAELIQKETGEFAQSEKQIKDMLQALFKTKMQDYLYLNDVAFHQAFVKFLSGTDNRAKNTYFQIIGKFYTNETTVDGEAIKLVTLTSKGNEGKKGYIADGTFHEINIQDNTAVPTGTTIPAEGLESEDYFGIRTDEGDQQIRLIGDDLDTILVTDNSGLQSKPYNLIEDSYDESYEKTWGDAGNIFFRMFDRTFEQEIKGQLKGIMDFAGITASGVNLKSGYFYNTFFKVQEDFPAIAYNHTSSIYYENAYVIKNCGASYGFSYTNNNVDPIAQSHGSCLECEKQFMKERIDFLAGYAKSCLDNTLITSSSGNGGEGLKLLLEFEPAQDFYPSYLYEVGNVINIGSYADSEYDIIKYKAVAGNKYTQTISEKLSAINQNLYQVGLYKTLSITGLQVDSLESDFNSTTDFTINNELIENNRDLFGDTYPKMMLEEFKASFPVLETLSLIDVVLPKELPLSDFNKLKTLNLSKSDVESVVFPQTGVFQHAVLPSTIKTFEIYNNVGLRGITFEGYNNIETVYIDCAKCGEFNVADFCENLSEVALKKVTLKNINNIYLTEDALDKLIGVDCILEGEITIINEIGDSTPKDISFATKLKLVNKFGNIDTGSNGLKINYTSSPISRANIQYPDEVSAFYNTSGLSTQVFDGLFSLTITSGNNVKIINEVNPYNPAVTGYLDIKYALQTTVTGVSINNTSGAITLTSQVNTNSVANVIISITTDTNTFKNDGTGQNPTPTRVSFAWKAPKLGDFAYADGTFSSYRNPNKTIVGLVYAREEETAEKGIVYVVGAKYSNSISHYTGYNSRNSSQQAGLETVEGQIYKLGQYLNNQLKVTNYYPQSLNVFTNMSNFNEIVGSKGSAIMSLPMTGKTDTLAYVTLVNGLLPKLVGKGIKLDIVSDDSGEYIKDIESLNSCCTTLDTSSLDGANRFNSALLYPYFYSAYLYEPELNNSDEVLHDSYKKGNWYAPSLGELARIIYYRGYSASSTFDMAAYVRAAIDENVLNGDGLLTTPIFSLAKSRGYLADVWNNIVGSGNSGTENNIITTKNLSESDKGDNYSYQTWSDWYDSNQFSEWVEGTYSASGGSADYYARNRTWSYTKHFGLPFTQIGYQKP